MQQQTDQAKTHEFVENPLSLREVTILLIKHYGLHEGFYDLTMEFTVGFGPIGPDPNALVPGALVGVQKLGLVKVPEAKKPTTINAAEVNPPKKKRGASDR